MTEAIFLAVIGILSAAVAKLWINDREQATALAGERSSRSLCEVKIAKLEGNLEIVQLKMKHLEDANLGQIVGVEEIAVSADHEGKITWWSYAAAKFFGYTISEAVGSTIEDLLVPESMRKSHGDGFRTLINSVKIETKHMIPNMPVLTKSTMASPDNERHVCDLHVIGDKKTGQWKFVTKFTPH